MSPRREVLSCPGGARGDRARGPRVPWAPEEKSLVLLTEWISQIFDCSSQGLDQPAPPLSLSNYISGPRADGRYIACVIRGTSTTNTMNVSCPERIPWDDEKQFLKLYNSFQNKQSFWKIKTLCIIEIMQNLLHKLAHWFIIMQASPECKYKL